MQWWNKALRLAWLAAAMTGALWAQGSHKTENVIFVMTDGLRWQEVFRGADAAMFDKEHGKLEEGELAQVKQAYWRETPEARRAALMPFLWSEVAQRGQIFGNRDKGSDAYVTNGLNFSYPGYSETMCGFADPRIHSNDKVPNPNVTVLEWLHGKPAFRGKVAAFGAWDVIASVFHPERAQFPINAGYDPFTLLPGNRYVEAMNAIKAETPRVWDDEPFDVVPFRTALEYMKEQHPRVLYISLGETDDWAHDGRYGAYLDAAHRVDAYLKAIWDVAQSMPQYKGKTTLIFSPDHGRGPGDLSWRDHGEKLPESKYIWMGFLGPDTKPLGERAQTGAVTQSQIAATLAQLLGEDYAGAVEKAGKPIADVLPAH